MMISVIIPTRYRLKELKDCINSLENQSSKPDEILIIADEGDEETENYFRNYKTDYFKIILLKSNGGTCKKRNLAIDHTKGEIIVFLDDDVILDKNYIKNTKENFIDENISNLILFAEKISSAFTSDRKLMLCGNGGSASDAQHIAAEFVNRFMLERPPLPAIALTTDTSIITSIGNDYTFDDIFSKQIKAIGVEGDVLLALSTSGNSANIISAVKAARGLGIYTGCLTGSDGGRLAGLVDMAMVVNNNTTPRIQETHILAGHIICQLVDYILFQQDIKDD